MKFPLVHQEYIAKTGLSITALILGLSSAIYLVNPLIGGLSIAAAYLLFISAEKASNIHGKTDEIKLLNSFTPNLIEFSALAATIYFNPEIAVSVLVIAVTGLYTSSQIETKDKVGRKVYNLFGRTERILALSTVFAISFLNTYLMLYGLIILSLLILTDLVYLVYRFLN